MGRIDAVAGGLAGHVWPGELPVDAAAACEAIAAQVAAVRVEGARRVVLVAHWLDLHAPVEHPDGRAGGVLPGSERYLASGADGTPLVAEFACAELGALLGTSPLSARLLQAKVANLVHRHPVLYARVCRGEVEDWKALETARLVGRAELGLTQAQAHWIDDRSHEWITTLPWAAYCELLEQLIIEVDPAGAQHRADAAATRQGVWTTQGTEHGLKTIVARAAAGEITYLIAVVDRIAAILAENGDTRPLEARRVAGFTLLAHPAHALAVLAEHAAAHAHDPDTPDDAPSDGDRDHADDGEEPGALLLFGDPADDPDIDDPGGGPDGEDGPPGGSGSGLPAGGVPRRGQWSFLTLPEELADALRLLREPGMLDRLLPAATLYLHLDQADLATNGPATVEGHGVITAEQARRWLGHRRVQVTPVVDLNAEHAPVQGYVFPRRLRQVMHLTNPRDTFPYGNAGAPGGAGKDADHVIAYRRPGPHRDEYGPPAQTGLHNGTLLGRFAHRLKTHGRWRLLQLARGVYLWHSPYGTSYLVDPLGTHPVPHAVLPWLLRGAHQHDENHDDDASPSDQTDNSRVA